MASSDFRNPLEGSAVQTVAMTSRAVSATSAPATGDTLGALRAPSPATVLVVDAAGIIVSADHGPQGERAVDVIGRSVIDVVAPEHAERIRAAIGRVVSEGSTEAFDLVLTGPADPVKAWAVVASPTEGGAAFVMIDITGRAREEARLRRSEALLVDAQGVAHLGTWEWDVTQPTAVWSDELYRIYGVTRETYTPSYEAYLTKVHPDDRARVMAVTEACFKEHKPYSHDERIFRANGEMRWLHTWAFPVLDESGKLVRLIGVCQDVTDAKHAEGAMRTQMMTRALARRLLTEVIRRAHVPDAIVRQLGRGLASERVGERSATAFVEAFQAMGFGTLRADPVQGARYEFAAADLIERRGEATLPTCHLTLGYLEGVVTALTGRPALGNEMRCQSMGHEECRFTVRVQ